MPVGPSPFNSDFSDWYTKKRHYKNKWELKGLQADYPTRKLKESQKYTTQVILNRVKSKDFPNTIRGVIYEKHNGIPQFSVTTNGAIDKCDLQYRTLLNVYDVLIHGTDLPSYVKYFYSASVKENWVCNLNTYKKTGGSIFAYKDKE